MPIPALLEEARALLPGMVALRRRIHRHPELGNDLPRTRAAVLDEIADLGLDVHRSASTSGLVAVLSGAGPGPTVLLRADMDALPMPEDTGLDYASEVAERMHACGHDAHTAMLTGAARLLARHRSRLRGRVSFMFQPGEEGPGGARPMLDEGVVAAGGPPDRAFALHVWPNRASGVVVSRPGPVLAAADDVRVRVLGRGGHGSMPHEALDPVPVACEIVQALQTFATRRFSPFDPVVITAGYVRAGTASNVIPEAAEMALTVRSLSPEARARAHAGIETLAGGIAAAHGLRAEIERQDGYPPTVNDPASTDLLAQTVRELPGAPGYEEMAAPFMGSEDFSYVLERIPGCFAFLGVAPPGRTPAEAAPCHSNRMRIDEAAMATGAALHAALAMRALEPGAP